MNYRSGKNLNKNTFISFQIVQINNKVVDLNGVNPDAFEGDEDDYFYTE